MKKINSTLLVLLYPGDIKNISQKKLSLCQAGGRTGAKNG